MNKRRISILLILLLVTFTLFGCNDYFNFNQKPDPALENINTTEKAVDFLLETTKSWNNIKAKIQVALINLPMEGHLDIANQQAYIEKYSYNEAKEKQINKYYYLTKDQIYVCIYSNNNPEYSTTNIIDEVNLEVSLGEYLNYLNKENINLENVTFENDSYQITISTTYTNNDQTYPVKIIYRNNKIKVVIEKVATITFEQDDPNYFDNLDIDLSLFK